MADNRWDGLDAALARMRSLPPKLNKSAFGRAGTKAMRPVRDAARAGAARLDDPDTASNIAKNIITRTGSRRDEARYGGNVRVTKVGVMGGARSKKYADNRANQKAGRAGKEYEVDDPETFHWRFLELGTRHMRARPFMLPALESNTGNVISIYASSLSQSIDEALRGAAKAAARRAAKGI